VLVIYMGINYLGWTCQGGDYLRTISHGRYRLGVKSLRCGSKHIRRAAGSIPATDISLERKNIFFPTWY
jgi:hypothetical protein